MDILLTQPLSSAWKRMTRALFKPFDIGKWFVVGFTAFLAGLLDGPHSGASAGNGNGEDFNFEELIYLPWQAWEWLQEHSGWAILISFALLVIVAIIVGLTWLSSRGKFMFLDNVVHNRSKVTDPWHRFKKLADSLFLWRLFFGLFTIVLIATLVVFLLISIGLLQSDSLFEFPLFLIVSLSMLILLTVVVLMYIFMFLENFVIPLMYKNDMLVLEGWKKFLQLLKAHPAHFILYGLFLFVLYIAVFVVIMFLGFFTCCIGFILLVIPYISSVILLPVSYTFRAFSLEFLEQFGPDYKLFPVDADTY